MDDQLTLLSVLQTGRLEGKIEASTEAHRRMADILASLKEDIQSLQSDINKQANESSAREECTVSAIISVNDSIDTMIERLDALETSMMEELEKQFYKEDGQFFRTFADVVRETVDQIKTLNETIQTLKNDDIEVIKTDLTKVKSHFVWFRNAVAGIVLIYITIEHFVGWDKVLSAILRPFGLGD